MKEKINEHDFTKNMMNIIRGGYKAKLITEAEGETDELESDEVISGENLGPYPTLYKLNSDYFELPFTDDRAIKIVDGVKAIAPEAIITDIYLSDKNEMAIFGKALANKLQFAITYPECILYKNTGTIQGNVDEITIGKLNGYMKNLEANATQTQELLYREKDDKVLLNKEG